MSITKKPWEPRFKVRSAKFYGFKIVKLPIWNTVSPLEMYINTWTQILENCSRIKVKINVFITLQRRLTFWYVNVCVFCLFFVFFPQLPVLPWHGGVGSSWVRVRLVGFTCVTMWILGGSWPPSRSSLILRVPRPARWDTNVDGAAFHGLRKMKCLVVLSLLLRACPLVLVLPFVTASAVKIGFDLLTYHLNVNVCCFC